MGHHTINVTNIVATAGTATGSGVSSHPLSGVLLAIGISQGNTPHANTDITITTEYGGIARTLLTLTNYATTALTWYDVREQTDNTAGSAISAQYSPIPLDGNVTVSVAQGGSASTCAVTLVYAEG